MGYDEGRTKKLALMGFGNGELIWTEYILPYLGGEGGRCGHGVVMHNTQVCKSLDGMGSRSAYSVSSRTGNHEHDVVTETTSFLLV